MKKFMAIYMAPAAVIAEAMKATPAEQQAGMDAWLAWQSQHEKALVDFGNPLGKTKRVSAGGAVSDTKNDLTGYTIVQADSLEAAAQIFKNHPHLKMGSGATVDILEVIPM
jgi:hypothetical protein